MIEVDPSIDTKRYAMAVRPISNTQVVLRVVNPLRPPETVSQDIEVQVFMRASPSFRVHGLKQASMYVSANQTGLAQPMNNFPLEYATSPPAYKAKSRLRTAREHFAETQMDDGAKEDLDPTADFSVGRAALLPQTIDDQTTIKDILRRPVLLFNYVSVAALQNNGPMGFFIPLMPPSKMMSHIANDSSIYSELMGQNPSTMIMNLFRFWRGSMRYTIVCYGSDVTYVTHVPHSGARIIGPRQIGNFTNARARPPYGSGLTTDMIVPKVNPTAVVEVPYDTENNWTLTFEDDPTAQYPWRDKGDTNAGHLILSSASSTIYDIWWSAGDDFQVANFYGVPKVQWDDARSAFDDQVATTQAEDFCREDVSNLGSSIADTIKNVGRKDVIFAAAGSIPIVGNFVNTLVTQAAVNKVKTKACGTMDKVDVVLDDVQEITHQIKNLSGPLVDSIEQIIAVATSRLDSAFAKMCDITKMASDLMSATVLSYTLRSYIPLATVQVNSLKDFAVGCLSIEQINTYISKLSQYFNNVASGAATTQSNPVETTPTIVAILVGLVGVIFKVNLSAYKYESMYAGLIDNMATASTFSYLNGVLTYVQRVYTIVLDIVKDALGLVDPEVAALQLLTSNSEFLRKFVTEAQILTADSSKPLRQTPSGRARYFMMTLQALQIQRAIVHTKGNPAMVELSKFVAGIVRKTEEHRMDLTACPIKATPYVFTMEGASGIGKSFAVHDILGHLHDSIGISPSPSGMSYTYQSGSSYWTNFSDQKFVLMDDYGQRTDAESIKAEADVLFNLVTDAPYTPPMAHLEDKKIYANPLGVVLLTNDAYANHLTQATLSKKAYLRRRGRLFRVDLKECYEGMSISDIPIEVLSKFDHLEIRLYKDNTDKNRGFENGVLSYSEFLEYIKKDFKAHHVIELAKQKKKLAALYNRINNSDVSEINFEDPYVLFSDNQIHEIMSSNKPVWSFSDILEKHALEVVRVAESSFELHHQADNVETAQVQMPGRLFRQSLNELWNNAPSWNDFASQIVSIYEQGSLSIGSLVASVLVPEHRCDMCSVAVECEYTCSKKGVQFCSNCALNQRLTGGKKVCPFCQEVSCVTKASLKWVSLFAVAILITNMGFNVLFRSYPLTSELVKAIFSGFVSYYSARGFVEYYKWVSNRAMTYVAETVHADVQNCGSWPVNEVVEDDPEPSGSKDSNIFDVRLQPGFTDVFNQAMSDSPVCQHQELYDNVGVCHFAGGEEQFFRVPFQVGQRFISINVSLFPCADHADCPFRDESTVKHFCTQYIQMRQSDLQALYANYVNEPHNRAYIRDQIPIFAIPDWMKEKTIDLPETWWEWLSGKWEKYGKLVKVLTGIAALFTIVVKLTAAFGGIGAESQFGASASASSEKSYVPRTRHHVFQKGVRQKYDEGIFSSTQSATNSMLPETAGKIFRNQVLIKIWTSDNQTRSMAGVGIRNRSVLMPKHYVKELRKANALAYPITIESINTRQASSNHMRRVYTFNEEDFSYVTTTDLAVLHLPSSFPLFKDARSCASLNACVEGANKTEPRTKRTGSKPGGALAPLTRRSKPNQTNQTHTINGCCSVFGRPKSG